MARALVTTIPNNYETAIITLDNGFTGGTRTVTCTRIGNLVTLTCHGDPTNASASSVSSSAGLVPEAYRPGSGSIVRNTYAHSTQGVHIVEISSAGTITTSKNGWDGLALAFVNNVGFSITYVKTDA